MNRKLIVANWKSNKNPQEALTWADELLTYTTNYKLNYDNLEVIVCPPYIDLSIISEKLKIKNFKLKISLGAQDVSPFPDGSYTGAVSAKQLAGLVKYCLVGHSERRKNFAENTELVGKKIDLLINNNIIPIICAQTIEEIPQNIKNYAPSQVIIMFEPASAISVNGVYKTENSETITNTIRTWQKSVGDYKFLYGGSVNPESIKELLATPAEGFVIGRASLTVSDFGEILQNV